MTGAHGRDWRPQWRDGQWLGRGVVEEAQGVRAARRARRRAARRSPSASPACCTRSPPPTIAGDAPRQPPERADQAHRLGQPGRVALDDRAGALGRLVPRGEPGAAGRDDEPGEAAVIARSAAATASAPSSVTRCSTTSNPASVSCSTSARPLASSRVPWATPSLTVRTFARSGVVSALIGARTRQIGPSTRPISSAIAVAGGVVLGGRATSPGPPRSRSAAARSRWARAVNGRMPWRVDSTTASSQVVDRRVDVTGDVGGDADVAAHRSDADATEAGDGDPPGVRLERGAQASPPARRRRAPWPPRRGSRRR